MNTETLTFNSKVDNVARVFALIGVFFIPLSPTLNILVSVAAVLTVFGGQLRAKFAVMQKYKMNYLAVLLMLLFLLGAFVNAAQLSLGIHGFVKYAARVLVLLLLLPLFIDARWRVRALNTFLVSIVLSTIVLLLATHNLLPHFLFRHKPFARILQPIPFSIFAAFCGYVLLVRGITDARHRLLNLFCFALLFVWLFFFNVERTGMLVFLSLLVLLAWQRFSWKGVLVGVIVCAALVSTMYVASNNFRQRIDASIIALQHIDQTPDASLAVRVNILRYGWQHVKAHPWLGAGTGLYTRGILSGNSRVVDPTLEHNQLNPENSYLHIALQIGMLGLLVFALWILTQWFETRDLPKKERLLAQALIVTLAVSNFTIIAFYLNQTALFYASFLAVFFAARFNQPQENESAHHTPLSQNLNKIPAYNKRKLCIRG